MSENITKDRINFKIFEFKVTYPYHVTMFSKIKRLFYNKIAIIYDASRR